MIEFFRTAMGQRFYEHTMPALVKEMTRLNANLEAMLVHVTTPPDLREAGPPNGAGTKLCPRCGSSLGRATALSRRDNKTSVCTPCGADEAYLDSKIRDRPVRAVLATWPWAKG